MKCPRCEADAPPGARFRGQCAAPLAAAYAVLAAIHGWFTEGFDTLDLRNAAELLRELTPASR